MSQTGLALKTVKNASWLKIWLGVKAATESTTRTEIDPDLTKVSAISSACSPVSG